MKAGNFSAAVIGMFKNDRLWGDFQALENAQKNAPFTPDFFPELISKSTCRSSTVFETNPTIQRRALDSGHVLDFGKGVLLGIVELDCLAEFLRIRTRTPALPPSCPCGVQALAGTVSNYVAFKLSDCRHQHEEQLSGASRGVDGFFEGNEIHAFGVESFHEPDQIFCASAKPGEGFHDYRVTLGQAFEEFFKLRSVALCSCHFLVVDEIHAVFLEHIKLTVKVLLFRGYSRVSEYEIFHQNSPQ